MRGFRAEMVEEILQDAVQRFGESAKLEPVYQDLHNFLVEVLQPYQGRFLPFKRLAKAVRMKRYTNKSDLRFFEVDKLSDIMKDPRIIMDHLPITGSYYDEYRTNFKIATHSHGPVSYIARRVMHEGFRETFIDETLDFELQKYFGDELQLILEGHGWQIPQVLANVFQLLHDTYRDKYFGLTQKVMADPRKLENQVEVLEKQVKRHLALRVEHFLRKQTTRQPLSSAENVFLLEIAITIVQQIIIPYVQSIHAEEAMLRDKHRPKTIRDIFKV